MSAIYRGLPPPSLASQLLVDFYLSGAWRLERLALHFLLEF